MQSSHTVRRFFSDNKASSRTQCIIEIISISIPVPSPIAMNEISGLMFRLKQHAVIPISINIPNLCQFRVYYPSRSVSIFDSVRSYIQRRIGNRLPRSIPRHIYGSLRSYGFRKRGVMRFIVLDLSDMGISEVSECLRNIFGVAAALNRSVIHIQIPRTA